MAGPSMNVHVNGDIEALRKNLLEGIGLIRTTTEQMTKMANSLSGDKLITAASKMVVVLNDMGGAATRTAQEAKSMAAFLEKAMSVAEARGKPVSAAMKQMHTDLKAVADQAEKTTGVFDHAFARLTSAFTVGSLLEKGISSIGEFVSGAFEAAGHVQDLSVKMGVSTEAVQRWEFAAKQAGTTIDAISQAVSQMSNRLASGDKSADAALEQMGLHLANIRAMRPEDAFNAIVAAIEKIPDPMQQTQIAMDLFGRSGAEILPAIREGFERIGSTAPIMAQQVIESLDRAEKRWQAAKASFSAGFATGISNAGDQMDTALEWAKTLTGWNFVAGAMSIDHGGPKAIADGIKSVGLALPEVAKGATDAAKATEQFNRQNADALALTQKNIAAYQQLQAEYKAFKQFWLTGVTDAERKQIEFELRFQKDTGQDIFVLKMKKNAIEDVMKATIALNAVPILSLAPGWNAPASGNGLINGSLPYGQSVGFAAPPVDPGIANAAADAALRRYLNTLALVATATHQLGQTGSTAWKLTMDGIGAAVDILGNYRSAMVAAQKVQDATARAAQIDAAAVSAAWAAATFGISVAIQFVIRAVEQHRQMVQTYRELRSQVQAYGIEAAQTAYGLTADIAALQAQLDDIARTQTDIQRALNRSTDALTRFGGHAPESLRPFIRMLEEANGLTDDQRQLLDAMDQPTTWQEMEAAANRYGIALDSLGQGYHQLQSNDTFDQMFSDWTMLSEAGADMTDVMNGMAGSVNTALQRALRFGTDVPEYMRPMLEAMQQMGLLIDENGNALTDLGRIHFSASIESSMDRIADVLETIRDFLLQIGGIDPNSTFAHSSLPRHGFVDNRMLPSLPKVVGGEILPSGGNPVFGNPVFQPTRPPSPQYAGATSQVSITIQAWDGNSVDQWLKSGGSQQLLNGVTERARFLGES